MIALLASPYGAPALMVACVAAIWAGAALGATWDRATTRIRHHYAPGSHRR